jgi:opacity protein-like surface antigen
VNFIRAVAALCGVLVVSVNAYAADLKGPVYKAPVASPLYRWDGFYLGVAAGGALQNTIIDDKICNLACTSWNMNGSGFTAGATAGWNFQFGHGVLGIEGDINWDNFKATFTDPDWPSYHSAKWNGFGTVRGRAGVAFDRVLMYATGGLAFVKIDDFGQSSPSVCDNNGCFKVNGVQTGIAVGGGFEYALSGPWSVKGEYLYVGLPSKNTHDLVRTGTSDMYNVMSNAHILRVGLNYNFGDHTTAYAWAPKSPLPAGATGSNWTGFYFGAVGGYGLQNAIIDDKFAEIADSSWNMNGSGFTVGGTAGWNYQFGHGLVGLEGDFNWANFKATFSDPDWGAIPAEDIPPIGSFHSEQWKWFSTLRARAGAVADRSLFYFTGGLALVDVNYVGQTGGDCVRGCFSVKRVEAGLAAGVGTEYAFAENWTAKGEYLYIDLPTKNTHDPVLTRSSNAYNVKSDAHLVRVGLNYHLDPIGITKSTPVATLPQWNGIYAGVNGGGALQNTIFDDKDCILACSSLNLNGSGFTGGGTIGWNHQIGSAVFGAEADFNWAGFKRSLTDPQWQFEDASIHSAQWKWFATARARGGLVVDQTLIYATAGFAFVDVDESARNTSGFDVFTVTGVKTGIAAGFGAEYALPGPWSLKGEYLYVGLPTKNGHDVSPAGGDVSPTSFTFNVKSDAHIVRAGVNYHFN